MFTKSAQTIFDFGCFGLEFQETAHVRTVVNLISVLLNET